MGNQQSVIQKCNFEDIQNIINKKDCILINTLNSQEQDCLIQGTILSSVEERVINDLLQKSNDVQIFIYGRNNNDSSIYDKYNQLIELGIKNIFVYCGGLFEWLCLQDIYGDDEFPTTCKQIDILRYKPVSHYNKLYLTN